MQPHHRSTAHMASPANPCQATCYIILVHVDDPLARRLLLNKAETRMRVAVPIWNNRVSPVFDTAQRLLLVDYEDGTEVARAEKAIDQVPLPRRATRLAEYGVDVLLCGAISRPLSAMLSGAGISVIPFVTGPVDDVLAACIEGRLPDAGLLMPGCGRRGRFRRGRRWQQTPQDPRSRS